MKHSCTWLMSAVVSVGLLGVAPSASMAGDEKAPSPFQETILGDLDFVSKRLVSLAEAIPAEKYAWRPTPEVRTVSEVFVHVAGGNLIIPSTIGGPPPEGIAFPEQPWALAQKWEAEIRAKEDVVRKLKESFAYVQEAVAAIPGEEMDQEIEMWGRKAPKRFFVLAITTHAHEHLGQAIAYARSVGVVPPWSQKPPARKPAEEPKE